MNRLLRGAIWGVLGYMAGAFGGGYLVSVVSPNRHDGSVEAAMTGAFVFGPVCGILAFIVGLMRGRPTPVK